MRFADEYRNKELIQRIARDIHGMSKNSCTFMEVCGGHTMAVHRYGLHSILPTTVKLLSGPGCPVCVTSAGFIDHAIALSAIEGMIITTFGDLIRVPGSFSTLEKEKMKGADVRIVYSVMDAIALAMKNPENHVVFLGIGFETTAPTSAAAIVKAKELELNNFSILSSHKIMPPVMEALIHEGVRLDGYIAPGHVSAITGTEIYKGIVEKLGLGVVVSGFEPADILQSIYMLVNQVEKGKPKVEIQYSRVVKPSGNPIAQKLMNEVFEPCDNWWRGFGIIQGSGLRIREIFEKFNASTKYPVKVLPPKDPKGCICGDILKGLKTPDQCALFNRICTPENPVGACMVSGEGSCAAYFKYGKSI